MCEASLRLAFSSFLAACFSFNVLPCFFALDFRGDFPAMATPSAVLSLRRVAPQGGLGQPCDAGRALARLLPRHMWEGRLVRPATLLRRHRDLAPRQWTYPSLRGRPAVRGKIRQLVVTDFLAPTARCHAGQDDPASLSSRQADLLTWQPRP